MTELDNTPRPILSFFPSSPPPPPFLPVKPQNLKTSKPQNLKTPNLKTSSCKTHLNNRHDSVSDISGVEEEVAREGADGDVRDGEAGDGAGREGGEAAEHLEVC